MRSEDRAAAEAALGDAIQWYHDQLGREIKDHTDAGTNPERPTTAREYWIDVRGLDASTVDDKLLGWAPPNAGYKLLERLREAGHTDEAILGTGLFTEDLRPLQNGRYVLPYFDEDGRVVYAITRATGPLGGGKVGYDGHPADFIAGKYAKLAHTKDYVPVDEPIYGRASVTEGEPVIITEGIIDAIAAHEAGYGCLSPVTTHFKKRHRVPLLDILDEHDVPRVYVVQDSEPPTSDLVEDREGWRALTIEEFPRGQQGAAATAGYLAENDVDARIARLPRPGLDKVDLDDYLHNWSETLDPILASSLPPERHPAYEGESEDSRQSPIDEARQTTSGSKRDSETGRAEASGDRSRPDGNSELFDLDLDDVAPVSVGYRGTNPLGHHGESENYYVVLDDGEVGHDHKYSATYNAQTYLLCESGERSASQPRGPLSDRELFAAWRHANHKGLLPEEDRIPRRALQHVARGSTDWDGELVELETGDGDAFDGLPTGVYNEAVEMVREKHGLEPGRDRVETDDELTAPIPFTVLRTLTDDELKRYARKRGYTWPTSGELSRRIRDEMFDTLEDEACAVIRGPTASDKTGRAVETKWRDIGEAVTGNRPVVFFCETRDARDEAIERAEAAGLDVLILRGRKEICPVCAGKYDPGGKLVDADDPDEPDPIVIDGEPVSVWIDDRCDGRGMAISDVHYEAEELLAKEGREMPCCPGDSKCGVVTQWPDGGLVEETTHRCAAADHRVEVCDECDERRVRCGDHDPDHQVNACSDCHTERNPRYDLVVTTDPFAHVPSLRQETNIIQDERPDYIEDFGFDYDGFDSGEEHTKAVSQRVRDSVTAFLEDAGIGPDTFEGLVELARETAEYPNYWNDLAPPPDHAPEELIERWKNTYTAFSHEPSHSWYLHHPDAHALAPALTRAIWQAIRDGFDGNGRATATVSHHPPRLDENTDTDEGWNRSYVTVVLDDRNMIRLVRNAPDFSTARSIVGLDARPTPWLWQRNVHPDMTVERVCNPDEARLWRRFERGQTVARIGTADRPAGRDGEYFNESHAKVIIDRLRGAADDDFNAVGGPMAFEEDLSKLLVEASADPEDIETLHYNEEKSRNPEAFAKAPVGLVYGCIDPGDDHVLDLLAECDLKARPQRADPDDGRPDPTSAYCESCEGDGCGECGGTGQKRAHGRGFIGPDADHATTLLESVRAMHVAQMIGRFGRDLHTDTGEHNITFVAGPAPNDLVDYQLPDVRSMGTKQAKILEVLSELGRAITTEIADVVGSSKKHVRQTLSDLVNAGVVSRDEGAGRHGADVWRVPATVDDLRSAGATALDNAQATLDQIATSAVISTNTWEVAICDPHGFDPRVPLHGSAATEVPPADHSMNRGGSPTQDNR